jgi:hypothetical protein
MQRTPATEERADIEGLGADTFRHLAHETSGGGLDHPPNKCHHIVVVLHELRR